MNERDAILQAHANAVAQLFNNMKADFLHASTDADRDAAKQNFKDLVAGARKLKDLALSLL